MPLYRLDGKMDTFMSQLKRQAQGASRARTQQRTREPTNGGQSEHPLEAATVQPQQQHSSPRNKLQRLFQPWTGNPEWRSSRLKQQAPSSSCAAVCCSSGNPSLRPGTPSTYYLVVTAAALAIPAESALAVAGEDRLPAESGVAAAAAESVPRTTSP